MANGRKEFLDVMHEATRVYSVWMQYRASSQKALEENLPSKVFSDFPCLLSRDAFSERCRKAQLIIEKLHVNEKSDVTEMKDEGDQNAIKGFITVLAEWTCNDLLDKDGQIKEGIIDLFAWHKYQKDMKPADILCGFFCIATQQIYIHLCESAKVDLNKAAVFVDFINKNYREFINKELKKRGFESIFEKGMLSVHAKVVELIKFSREEPVKVAGYTSLLVGGALAVWKLTSVAMEIMNPPKPKENKR